MKEPRQLRESGFVLHSLRGGAQGNQEDFEVVQPRMIQHVNALWKHTVQGPQKDQRELMTDLPFGTRAAHLAALGRLNQTQRAGGSITNREVLPDHVDEVGAREPLEVCHPVIVSTCAHAWRNDT
jgi:hypothetical protein